jgi:hypothetical protein
MVNKKLMRLVFGIYGKRLQELGQEQFFSQRMQGSEDRGQTRKKSLTVEQPTTNAFLVTRHTEPLQAHFG